MQIEVIEVWYGAAGLSVISPVNCCPLRDCERKYGVTHSVIIMIVFKILWKCLSFYILPWEKEQTEILLAPFKQYANLHPKQENTKESCNARMRTLFWEASEWVGWRTSCRLEDKGGTMPAMLHAQHEGSTDSWRDGLQRREQIRCSPCSDFPKLQAKRHGRICWYSF